MLKSVAMVDTMIELRKYGWN
jgi:hypothetical protein